MLMGRIIMFTTVSLCLCVKCSCFRCRYSEGVTSKGACMLQLCVMSVKSPSDLLNENAYVPPSLTLDLCLSHERKLGLTDTRGSTPFSLKSQLNYGSTNSIQLLKGVMGGLDDDDASLRHQEDEWSRNQENEHGLPGSESNAKWMKEDQNQICKLAEQQQQDQNLNLVENKNESTDRNPNQNPQRRHEEKNKTLKALCSDLRSWAADEPLLIYSSDTLMEKNHESQEQMIDEEAEREKEENLNPSGAENADSSEIPKKGGEGGGRNACLLFSKNAVPSDEDSSCMSLSQGSTASSTPDGEPGRSDNEMNAEKMARPCLHPLSILSGLLKAGFLPFLGR